MNKIMFAVIAAAVSSGAVNALELENVRAKDIAKTTQMGQPSIPEPSKPITIGSVAKDAAAQAAVSTLHCELSYNLRLGQAGQETVAPQFQFTDSVFKARTFCDDGGCQTQQEAKTEVKNPELKLSVRVLDPVKVEVFAIPRNGRSIILTFGPGGIKAPYGMLVILPLEGTYDDRELISATVSCAAY